MRQKPQKRPSEVRAGYAEVWRANWMPPVDDRRASHARQKPAFECTVGPKAGRPYIVLHIPQSTASGLSGATPFATRKR